MKERGMIFNAEMIRALLDGRKTQTRRIMKVQPSSGVRISPFVKSGFEDGHGKELSCPFGQPGARIWVRETWADVNHDGCPAVAYRADGEVRDLHEDDGDEDDPRLEKYWFAAWYPDLISGTEGNWTPSIHMPRWASRITLEITDVRVERLNSISEEDAAAEGVGSALWFAAKGVPEEEWASLGEHGAERASHINTFATLWESIYGTSSWQANPWVWVLEFKRVDGGAA